MCFSLRTLCSKDAISNIIEEQTVSQLVKIKLAIKTVPFESSVPTLPSDRTDGFDIKVYN